MLLYAGPCQASLHLHPGALNHTLVIPDWHCRCHVMSCHGCTRVSELQQQLVAAHAEAGKAHAWRQRWEVCQMHVEDLTACNARAMQRRQELVSSYW